MNRTPAAVVVTAPDDWRGGPILSLTRIRFRHWWFMALAAVRFRRLYGDPLARAERGLLRGVIAIEGPSTLLNVSIWQDERTMLLWSGNNRHVDEVRWSYSRVAEAWSALFDLRGVSRSAHSWGGYFSPELREKPNARDSSQDVRDPNDPTKLEWGE